ncbi:hypothetical protein D932_01450 [Enterococcus casseliflavus 14-MB-W-14]|nr:hypothetical protein D932_01450 [Enterococcus casseliflavus 14-MB-W-14]
MTFIICLIQFLSDDWLIERKYFPVESVTCVSHSSPLWFSNHDPDKKTRSKIEKILERAIFD